MTDLYDDENNGDLEMMKRNASPHKGGPFWRLMNYFGLAEHPKAATYIIGADRENASSKYLSNTMQFPADRSRKYDIYNEMDKFDLVISVLDLYAEEVTQVDYDRGKTVWIESNNQKLVEEGEVCLRNLQVETQITAMARSIEKYGDLFMRLIYESGKGVLWWKYAPEKKTSRVEDKYGRVAGFREKGKTFRGTLKRRISFAWDYVHFRLLGKDMETSYGTSILDAMFRPWRQLTLSEDAMLMYRLRRAPSRFMVLVDIGDMEEHEGISYVEEVRKRFNKTEYVDPASGKYDKQFNPLTPLENFYLATRGDRQGTRIETINGDANVGDVYDIEYLRDKFFGSAKVPKAYMGFEGDINAKATLMQQDVRFARTCKRVRRALLFGLRQVLDTHFILRSVDPATGDDPKKGSMEPEAGQKTTQEVVAGSPSAINEAVEEQAQARAAADRATFTFDPNKDEYVVQMTPISYLDEWERLELIELRYRIVDSMYRLGESMRIDTKVWAMYVLLNYAKLPEHLVLKLVAKMPDPGRQDFMESELHRVWRNETNPELKQKLFEDLKDMRRKNAAEAEGDFTHELTAKASERILEEYGSEIGTQIIREVTESMEGTRMPVSLPDAERKAIAKLMAESKELQKVVGNFQYYFEDEIDELHEKAQQQIDPSLLPPTVGGAHLVDSVEEDAEIKQLNEDVAGLQDGSVTIVEETKS